MPPIDFISCPAGATLAAGMGAISLGAKKTWLPITLQGLVLIAVTSFILAILTSE